MGARFDLPAVRDQNRIEHVLRRHGVAANIRTEQIKGPRPPEVVRAIIAEIQALPTFKESPANDR